jgi:tight adherence protein B
MLLVTLVFVVVFGTIAGLIALATGGGGSSRQARAALDVALKLPDFSRPEDVVDIRKSVMLSSLPWLNTFLARIRTVTELKRLLDQAGMSWTPGRLVLGSVAGWVIGSYLVNLRTGLGWPSVLVGFVVGAAPFVYVLRKKARRFRLFELALPDALDMVVSALRGGQSMVSAFGIAANEAPEPVGRELRICFEEQNFGLDLRTALDNLVRRMPLADLRMVTTCIVIQKESGGNLAEVLDKTAQVIRDRFRIRQQIRTHTAQGRMTGWILSILPFGLGLILFLISPEHMNLLFSRPLGHKMIAAGVGMNIVGLLIIRKIVNIRV